MKRIYLFLSYLVLFFATSCGGAGTVTLGGDGAPIEGMKPDIKYAVRLLTTDYIFGIGFKEDDVRVIQVYDRGTESIVNEVIAVESSDGSRLSFATDNFLLSIEDYTQLDDVNTAALKYLAEVDVLGVTVSDDYFTNPLPVGLGAAVLDCTGSASPCAAALELDSSWIDLAALKFYLKGNGSGAVSTAANAILDSSLGAFTGTASNGADGSLIYTGAPVGEAFDFDGVNDVIDFNVSATDLGIEGPVAKTIVAWVNPRKLSNTVFLMGSFAACGTHISLMTQASEGDWTIGMQCDSRRITFDCGNLNTWSHIAVAIDGNNAKVYCNGVLAAENNASRSLSATSFKVGAGDGVFYDGKLDEFSVWSKALSAEEIFTIYTQQRPL